MDNAQLIKTIKNTSAQVWVHGGCLYTFAREYAPFAATNSPVVAKMSLSTPNNRPQRVCGVLESKS